MSFRKECFVMDEEYKEEVEVQADVIGEVFTALAVVSPGFSNFDLQDELGGYGIRLSYEQVLYYVSDVSTR
jgi:hypothetical protein